LQCLNDGTCWKPASFEQVPSFTPLASLEVRNLRRRKNMYTVSDAIEMGDAQDLILSSIKQEFVQDDSQEQTLKAEEYFDE
jgi:hypothetical protein